jgi:type I restriction enzyme S subunit
VNPRELPWGDRLPDGWDARRLRYLSTLNPSKKELRAIQPDRPVSFVPMEAVGEWGGLRLDEVRPVGEVGPGYTFFADGDVVVAKVTPCFENGKGALAKGLTGGFALGTTELHVLRAGPRLDRRFLFYLTETHPFRSIGASEMYGAGGQKRVPEWFFRDFVAPVPPLAVQRAIADFLDRKTAAIDALIEKKERLLRLLAEKRHAVLTRTVTGGLDATAPTKASGVPWFASIPAHWGLKKLKYASPQVTVGIVVTPAKYYVDEGVPALRSFNIRPGRITDSDLAYISPDANELHAKSKLAEGDLVAVRTGQPGTTAVVDQRFDGANCVDLIIIRRSGKLTSRFACYFMNSGPAHQQYGEGAEGALQQHFNVETAKSLVLPLPPVAEQDAIVTWLDRELARIDAGVTAVERQVAALREYRQALITAAVTGQLDVSKEAA